MTKAKVIWVAKNGQRRAKVLSPERAVEMALRIGKNNPTVRIVPVDV